MGGSKWPPAEPEGCHRDAPKTSVITNLRAVDGEDLGASEHESGDGWGDEVDGGMRGWIPPDDRLWRHPSESSPPTDRSGGTSPAPDPRSRDRTGPWLLGGATACVIVALVAAGLVMATTSSSEREHRHAPQADLAHRSSHHGTRRRSGGLLPPSWRRWSRPPDPPIVGLVIDTARGTVFATGLVVEAGGIIVTTSRAVARGPVGDGRRRRTGARSAPPRSAPIPATGISVLQDRGRPDAATLDFSGPSSGSVAMAMALDPTGTCRTGPRHPWSTPARWSPAGWRWTSTR